MSELGTPLAVIRVTLDGCAIRIYPASEDNPEVPFDFKELQSATCLLEGRTAKGGDVPFRYDPTASARGLQPLRLYENTRYCWEVEGIAETNGPFSSLKSPGRAEWHVRRRKERIEGDFRVTNYLGTA